MEAEPRRKQERQGQELPQARHARMVVLRLSPPQTSQMRPESSAQKTSPRSTASPRSRAMTLGVAQDNKDFVNACWGSLKQVVTHEPVLLPQVLRYL